MQHRMHIQRFLAILLIGALFLMIPQSASAQPIPIPDPEVICGWVSDNNPATNITNEADPFVSTTLEVGNATPKNEYKITFLGYDDSTGKRIWCYQVEEISGLDLSFVFIGLCGIDLVEDYGPTAADDGIKNVEINSNVNLPPGGGYPNQNGGPGIKWELEPDYDLDGDAPGDSRAFAIVTDVEPGNIHVLAVKAGAPASGGGLEVDFDLSETGHLPGPSCVATAVELASLTATLNGTTVTVDWVTEAEIENAGFNIYRSSLGRSDLVKINDQLIAALGSRASGHSYSLTDAPGIGTWSYYLEDVDLAGVRTLHGPVTVSVGQFSLYLPAMR